MICPQCSKELFISETALLNLERFHESLVVKTECCGHGVRLRHVFAFNAEAYTGDQKRDDFNEIMKPVTAS